MSHASDHQDYHDRLAALAVELGQQLETLESRLLSPDPLRTDGPLIALYAARDTLSTLSRLL